MAPSIVATSRGLRIRDVAVSLGMLRTVMLLWSLSAVGLLAAVGATAKDLAADEMTIVVSRTSDAVEVFIALPMTAVESTFGDLPVGFANADRTVDYERLRLGTWQIGDALFDSVKAIIGGQAVRFEALSMMVHPASLAMPLQTPLDGLIAISVCSVATPLTPPRLHELQIYMGFIAYTDDPSGALSLNFQAADGSALHITVRDFTDARLTNHLVSFVTNGALPSLTPGVLNRSALPLVILLLQTILISGFLAFGLSCNRRSRSAARAA